MPAVRLSMAFAAASAFALAGCASDGKAKAAEPAAPVVKREDFLTLLDGGVPDGLKSRIEVRNYSFEPGDEPRVGLEVFNVSENEPLSFEIRTLFFRDDSTLVDATEWVQGGAPPRGAFRYRAESFSPWAEKEQVQLRLVRSGAGS